MYRHMTALTLAALALAACGGDDAASPTAPLPSTPVSGAPATSTTGITTAPDAGTPDVATTDVATTAAADEPVTIAHLYGETVIAATPQRIVSLDMQWTDVLTALGTPPVAAAVDSYEGDWFPWQQADGVEQVVADATIPYETIAALQPDLIVGSWGIADEASYDLLAAIAPTIPLLAERQVDPWQEMAAVAGRFLGVPDAATALIAEAEQRSADLVAELPGLEGTTYVLANYVPGDAIYVVADPDDGASQVFAQLGMQIDPEILALADGTSGRVSLSLERIGELDADVLLLLTNGADPNEILGYAALPAVQSGAVSVLEYAEVVGLNTPSPLSIPYSLEFIRPALAAAIAD